MNFKAKKIIKKESYIFKDGCCNSCGERKLTLGIHTNDKSKFDILFICLECLQYAGEKENEKL